MLEIYLLFISQHCHRWIAHIASFMTWTSLAGYFSHVHVFYIFLMSSADYEFVNLIGTGSFGEVHLVTHKKDYRHFVMKRIRIQSMSFEERENTKQEVSLMSCLRHPAIVMFKEAFSESVIFGEGQPEEVLCIVMEYCPDGDVFGNLKKRLNNEKGPYPDTHVVDWLIHILFALHYLHERNILHRDLKLQNLFLTPAKVLDPVDSRRSAVKLGDFGVARILTDSSQLAQTQIGTPYYMSPELFRSMPYNHKSDMWALGCVLQEMLTGKHAFQASSLSALALKVLRSERRPLESNSHGPINPELKQIVDSLLTPDPQQRPDARSILHLSLIRPRIKKSLDVLIRSAPPELSKLSERIVNAQAIKLGLGALLGLSGNPSSVVIGAADRRLELLAKAQTKRRIEAVEANASGSTVGHADVNNHNTTKQNMLVTSSPTSPSKVQSSPQKKSLQQKPSNQVVSHTPNFNTYNSINRASPSRVHPLPPISLNGNNSNNNNNNMIMNGGGGQLAKSSPLNQANRQQDSLAVRTRDHEIARLQREVARLAEAVDMANAQLEAAGIPSPMRGKFSLGVSSSSPTAKVRQILPTNNIGFIGEKDAEGMAYDVSISNVTSVINNHSDSNKKFNNNNIKSARSPSEAAYLEAAREIAIENRKVIHSITSSPRKEYNSDSFAFASGLNVTGAIKRGGMISEGEMLHKLCGCCRDGNHNSASKFNENPYLSPGRHLQPGGSPNSAAGLPSNHHALHPDEARRQKLFNQNNYNHVETDGNKNNEIDNFSPSRQEQHYDKRILNGAGILNIPYQQHSLPQHKVDSSMVAAMYPYSHSNDEFVQYSPIIASENNIKYAGKIKTNKRNLISPYHRESLEPLTSNIISTSIAVGDSPPHVSSLPRSPPRFDSPAAVSSNHLSLYRLEEKTPSPQVDNFNQLEEQLENAKSLLLEQKKIIDSHQKILSSANLIQMVQNQQHQQMMMMLALNQGVSHDVLKKSTSDIYQNEIISDAADNPSYNYANSEIIDKKMAISPLKIPKKLKTNNTITNETGNNNNVEEHNNINMLTADESLTAKNLSSDTSLMPATLSRSVRITEPPSSKLGEVDDDHNPNEYGSEVRKESPEKFSSSRNNAKLEMFITQQVADTRQVLFDILGEKKFSDAMNIFEDWLGKGAKNEDDLWRELEAGVGEDYAELIGLFEVLKKSGILSVSRNR